MSDMKRAVLQRAYDRLSADVTTPVGKLEEIESLMEDGSDQALAMAMTICIELLSHDLESGRYPYLEFNLRASDLLESATEAAWERKPGEEYDAISVIEEFAEKFPEEVREGVVLGIHAGRMMAMAEFEEMQKAAMEQAMQMVEGMGLGGVMSMVAGGGGAFGGDGLLGGAVQGLKQLLPTFGGVKKVNDGDVKDVGDDEDVSPS